MSAPELPDDALSESFLASSGPGGQNVNKVATACQLRCEVFKLGLSPEVFRRLRMLAGSRMTAAGEIVITARKFRTQEANRQDARDRLAKLVAEAHVVQPSACGPSRPARPRPGGWTTKRAAARSRRRGAGCNWTDAVLAGVGRGDGAQDEAEQRCTISGSRPVTRPSSTGSWWKRRTR
jgi:ribosome-associated protein